VADSITRLVVDCSVVVKWNIPTEDHATAAEERFTDWEHEVVEVYVPNYFQSDSGGRVCPWASRYANASNNAFASCRSAVSNPSVNQP